VDAPIRACWNCDETNTVVAKSRRPAPSPTDHSRCTVARHAHLTARRLWVTDETAPRAQSAVTVGARMCGEAGTPTEVRPCPTRNMPAISRNIGRKSRVSPTLSAALLPQGGARAGSQTGCLKIAGQPGQFSWALPGHKHRRPRRTWTVILRLHSSIRCKDNRIPRLDEAVLSSHWTKSRRHVYLVGAPVAAVPAFSGSPISLPRSVLSHRRPRRKLPRRRARRTLPAVAP